MQAGVRFTVVATALALGCLALPAQADINGAYKERSGDRWLHVRQSGNEVFILGELQRNYWYCTSTATTPGTRTESAQSSCLGPGSRNIRPSTFVFKGTRRGADVTGNYYFVPQGSENASGQATFTYTQSGRGRQQISVTRGALAAQPFYKMLNEDQSGVAAGTERQVRRILTDRKWLFAPLQEDDYVFSFDSEDLTDIWFSGDGSTFYIAQYGNTVAWLGENPAFGNVHIGIGEREGNRIEVRWSDVPRGDGSSDGTTRYVIESASHLRYLSGGSLAGGDLRRRGQRRIVQLTDLYNYPENIGRGQRAWAPGGDKDMTPTENLYGDREFDGNGPHIVVDVELRAVRNRIVADIEFVATETGGDGSIGRGRWSHTVYTAPVGRTIERILSLSQQRIEFESDDGGGGADNWSRSEAYHTETFDRDAVLDSYTIIGDTRGDDISSDRNPLDDTRIQRLAFKPALILLSPLQQSGTGGGTVADLPVPPVIRTDERQPVEDLGPLNPATEIGGTTACRDALQGRIAWDYDGSTLWAATNLERMCGGAPRSTEPARCFQTAMHGGIGEGGISWGGGNRWQWQNAVELCAGVTDADATISCFRQQIANGADWQAAIRACR